MYVDMSSDYWDGYDGFVESYEDGDPLEPPEHLAEMITEPWNYGSEFSLGARLLPMTKKLIEDGRFEV